MTESATLLVGLGSIFGAIAVSVALVTKPKAAPTGVARSLAYIEQLGSGHHDPVVELEKSFLKRVVVPNLGRLAGLGHRLSPSGAAARIQRQLDMAGNPRPWTPERIMGAKAAGLLGGALLGFLLTSSRGVLLTLLGTAGASAFCFFLPDILVYNAGIKRQEELRKSLAESLDMLTVCVEAGLGFDAALSQVARNTEGPIAGEFYRVLQEMQIGKSRIEAFQAVAHRTSVEELRTFVSALVQADKLGVPIANVLREQSSEMRLKRRQRAEEKAQQVPVKILFPLVFFVLPCLFIVVLGPGAIQIVNAFSNQL